MKPCAIFWCLVFVSFTQKALKAHECEGDPAAIDIAVFIEDHNKTGSQNFEHQIEFLKEFVHMSTISSSAVKFAVSQYAVNSNDKIKFDDYNDAEQELLDKIDDLIMMANTVDTSDLDVDDNFEDVFRDKIFEEANGGRDGVPKYMIIFITSEFTDWEQASDSAAMVHKTGIESIIIAGGSSYPEWVTKALASDPNLFMTIDHFFNLTQLLPALKMITCKGAPEILSFNVNSMTSPITVDPGTILRFNCKVEGNDAPYIDISGTHTGSDVITRAPRSYAFIQEADVTILSKAGQSDEYVCTAINELGTVQSSAVLVLVNGPPELHGTPTDLDQPLVVSATGLVTFALDIRSQPAPVSYTLTKTDSSGTVTLVAPSDGFSANFQSVNVRYGTLTISVTSAPYDVDSQFTLTVDNGHGTLGIPFTAVNNSGPPLLYKETESSSEYSTIISNTDAQVSISFMVVSHPEPTAYVLTYTPQSDQQSVEVMDPADYTVTFQQQNALHGELRLDFSKTTLKDTVNRYTLTVDNGEGDLLDIPFTALHLKDPDSEDNTAVIMVGCVLAGLILLLVVIFVLVLVAQHHKISALLKRTQTPGSQQNEATTPTMMRHHIPREVSPKYPQHPHWN